MILEFVDFAVVNGPLDCHVCGSSCLQVYLFAEALAEGAVKMGMPSALAHSIATQTVLVIFTVQALWFHCKCNVSSFRS